MSKTEALTFLSGLAVLLRHAANKGFDHIIIDKSDWGETIGIGFKDADGGRVAVRIENQDAMAWEQILKRVKE